MLKRLEWREGGLGREYEGKVFRAQHLLTQGGTRPRRPQGSGRPIRSGLLVAFKVCGLGFRFDGSGLMG